MIGKRRAYFKKKIKMKEEHYKKNAKFINKHSNNEYEFGEN